MRDHRSRREPAQPDAEAGITEQGSIAARVAERWRDAPSYGELLRASAHAAEQAAAAAEAAAQAARLSLQAAEAAAERDVFADPFFTEPFFTEAFFTEPCATSSAPVLAGREDTKNEDPWWSEAPFAVEHHAPLPERNAPPQPKPASPQPLVDPFAEAVKPAAQSLPAKLIEFPRELVATRKQRPRLAEGPLLDTEPEVLLRPHEAASSRSTMESAVLSAPSPMLDSPTDPRQPGSASEDVQRRTGFFESSPARMEGPAWGAIQLGEHSAPEAAAPPAREIEAVPALTGLAPISNRLMAALVDGSLVFAAFLLSVLVFASSAAHVPWGKTGIALAAGALLFEAVFYGWLFMSFGGGSTPGMRYARIALCTFNDENPTRGELQARVPATALALLPLGLGVLWALLDGDRLGWHDRMTRTYQRRYR